MEISQSNVWQRLNKPADLDLYSREVLVQVAREKIDGRDFKAAKRVISDLLSDDHGDPWALVLWAYMEMESSNYGMAAKLFERAIDEETGENLYNLYCCYGHSLHMLWRHEEAIPVLRRAIAIDHTRPDAWINLACCMLWGGRPAEAIECATKALELDPGSPAAIDNLATAQLALGDWANGWDNYEVGLGGQFRVENHYGDIPRWEGEPGRVVVVYGEQGLGDELMFASIIPALIRVCDHVIIDCDHRLQELFKESFPEASVYGTRWDMMPLWREDAMPEFKVSFGTLGKFFRRADEDFPGDAFAKPDLARDTQWRALFETMNKPVVGIAWTGGVRTTGKRDRDIPLSRWGSILKHDCHFVDLEYKDRGSEVEASAPEVLRFPWATLDKESYSQTAAIVNNLDLVITVPTSIVHLAGALGKECWVLVPKNAPWRFGLQGEGFIWHNSVRLIRQGEDETWADVIERVGKDLHEYFCRDGSEKSGAGLGIDVLDTAAVNEACSVHTAAARPVAVASTGTHGLHVSEVSSP